MAFDSRRAISGVTRLLPGENPAGVEGGDIKLQRQFTAADSVWFEIDIGNEFTGVGGLYIAISDNPQIQNVGIPVLKLEMSRASYR